MLSVCVCVCVCALSHRASEPSILVSPGPEGPGKQSCGGGEGRTPLCGPSLLFWNEAWDPHPGAGCIDGEAFQEVVPMAEQC